MLTLVPRDNITLGELGQQARLLKRALGASGVLAARVGERACEVARLADQRIEVVVEETADGVRVQMTTADPSRLDELRSDARDFADEFIR